jgi:hypothetical protein
MKSPEQIDSPSEFEQKQDSYRPEHLEEGIRPIMACIGTFDQYKNYPEFKETFKDLQKIDNVNYYEDPADLAERNFKNAGRDSYVISPVDALDKFSRSLADCTGVVAVGRDKSTGENISFLSHQDPWYFLRPSYGGGDQQKKRFLGDLETRLRELQTKSLGGTIDAVIVGGNWFKDPSDFEHGKYIESIKLLSAKIKEVLGFEPVVITGPKTIPGDDNIYYDNKHRRLYVLRPEVGKTSTENFSPNSIDVQEEKWQSEE